MARSRTDMDEFKLTGWSVKCSTPKLLPDKPARVASTGFLEGANRIHRANQLVTASTDRQNCDWLHRRRFRQGICTRA